MIDMKSSLLKQEIYDKIDYYKFMIEKEKSKKVVNIEKYNVYLHELNNCKILLKGENYNE